jgi:hypothetical protein
MEPMSFVLTLLGIHRQPGAARHGLQAQYVPVQGADVGIVQQRNEDLQSIGSLVRFLPSPYFLYQHVRVRTSAMVNSG